MAKPTIYFISGMILAIDSEDLSASEMLLPCNVVLLGENSMFVPYLLLTESMFQVDIVILNSYIILIQKQLLLVTSFTICQEKNYLLCKDLVHKRHCEHLGHFNFNFCRKITLLCLLVVLVHRRQGVCFIEVNSYVLRLLRNYQNY